MQGEKFLEHAECRKLLKAIFEKLVNIKEPSVRKEWGEFLEKRGIKIKNKYVSEWVRHKARKGALEEQNSWEDFQKLFALPFYSVSDTTTQTCKISMRIDQPRGEEEKFPRSIIVWNGNGVRARMDPKRSELKSLVHAINPSLLCFLEAKINSEKLFEIQGFEEWVRGEGFIQLFCYWSVQEGKAAHGGEGILILTKVPCEVSYGIGDPEFDNQARVATLAFPEVLIIVSYNPQGGFSEQSHKFLSTMGEGVYYFSHKNERKRRKRTKRNNMGG